MDKNIPDRGPAVFAVTTVTFVFSAFFVGVRIICRYGIVRNIGWDAEIMMLAWPIAFFLSLIVDLGFANGLWKHDDDISDYDRVTLRCCGYVFPILYVTALNASTRVEIQYPNVGGRATPIANMHGISRTLL